MTIVDWLAVILLLLIMSAAYGVVLYLGMTRHSKLNKKLDNLLSETYTPPPVYVDTDGIERRIKDVPNKVLQSIQGSINTHKGALGELIGYLELRGKYDRIIPIGNIVDFICIRFPNGEDEGILDFVDVKTGGASRLNKDQRSLQSLIDDKKIGFVKLKVTDEKIAGDEDDSE